MKLIIQIPCYNEEDSLPHTIQSLPGKIPGIRKTEILVIDDGSTDGTVETARRSGAHHVVRLAGHQGLAAAFSAGLEACLKRDADIIVNLDADNQHPAEDIPQLIAPILQGQADIVVGDRDVSHAPEFSPTKRLLQKFGSWVVEQASGLKVPDATCGFRAFSRDAAARLFLTNSFSHTLETLIQAGASRMAVGYVRVQSRPALRPSRMLANLPRYLGQSVFTIFRTYVLYRPMRVFFSIGSITILGGLLLGIRYIILYLAGFGPGHLQSLLLSAVLLILGFQILLIGLLADLISMIRRQMEEAVGRLRTLEMSPTPARKRKTR